jgi:hypothetical protein
MGRKRPLTQRGVRKLAERERELGLDPADAAAKWLEEHDPKPPPVTPKSATKSKHLHRYRRSRGGT